MQYIWQHRLWPATDMFTVDGRKIHVIDPGRLNTDSGPDFFNAKIYIDGRLWAGDVEIHVRATDWHRHGHDVTRPDGQTIPQMRMPCAPDFHIRYSQLVDAPAASLPCASHIAKLSRLHLSDWMSSLAYERLYAKTDRIDTILSRLSGDWESACYITIARALGFGINGDPFERLALSMPLNIVGKHSDSLIAIEALLFGQSGLIAPSDDPYVCQLQREYAFLCHKFGLKAPQSLGWKMARMRPANFPHRRIATCRHAIRRLQHALPNPRSGESRAGKTDFRPATHRFLAQSLQFRCAHRLMPALTRSILGHKPRHQRGSAPADGLWHRPR